MTLVRHTPLRRTATPRRKVALRQFSPRRESERDRRRTVVAAVLERDGHRCQARAIHPGEACRGPLDPHEIVPRSAWAGGHLVASNVLTVCRLAHELIDHYPDRAHSLGLHGFSWERQA